MNLKEFEGKQYSEMIIKYLNPKAVEQAQLYGSFDEDSRVWHDGIFPKIVIELIQMNTSDEKWIVFDGPIDNIWMENMNSVFDDNNKLCLPSGTVINLEKNTTMFFEVEKLKYASPAIVSRCGTIFMQNDNLDWNVLAKSYIESLPEVLTPKIIKFIEEIIASVLNPTMIFLDLNAKFRTEIKRMHLVKNFLNIFESFISDSRLEGYKLPTEDRKSVV